VPEKLQRSVQNVWKQALKVEKLTARKKRDQLAKFVNEKAPAVRIAAIKGLGQAGGEVAFNNLVTLLRDPEANIRQAASALEALKDPKSFAFFSARLKDETDDSVKEAINRALKAVQSNS
jgi:HEAT repeat protein